MMIEFKNGSHIKAIDTPGNKRRIEKEPDMSDIDWFCDFMGFNLFPWQKVFVWLWCRDNIRNMRRAVEYAHDYYTKE